MWTESLDPANLPPFASEEHKQRTEELLHALNVYRAAEAAMRRRVRETVGLGENDVLAMRFLLRAQLENRPVSPKDISAYLGISSASTTAMLDRLEGSGRVRREVSPTDRRALVIVPTISKDDEIRSMLGEIHPYIIDVASSLDKESGDAIIEFLTRMHSAVDRIQP